MKNKQKKISQRVAVVDLLRPTGLFCFVMDFAKMRGICTQEINYALKNTLVQMKDEQKEKLPMGALLHVRDLKGVFMFVKQVAKMRGICTQEINYTLKNTLVQMKDEQKEKLPMGAY